MCTLVLLWRYLRRPITVIPLLAVGLAVYVLIVVLAVMNGFAGYIRDNIRGTLSDLVVQAKDFRGATDAQVLQKLIQDVPGVASEGVSPQVSGKAILTVYGPEGSGQAYRALVRYVGVDLVRQRSVSSLAQDLPPDLTDLQQDRGPEHLPGILLGTEVIWPNTPGMVASLTAPALNDIDVSMQFVIAGFLRSGLDDFDNKTAYIGLSQARQLLGTPEGVTGFHVRLVPGANLERVRDAVAAALPPGRFTVETWLQTRRAMLLAIAMERIIWATVLSSLLVVAGFSILAVLSLLVLQKTRDIGIVRAVGGSVPGVGHVFVGYGLVVGLVGAGAGTALAWLTLRYIDPIEAGILALTGYTPWPREIFYFSTIPCDRDPFMMTIFFAAGVVGAVLASLYPAWRAASLNPVDTLRYE